MTDATEPTPAEPTPAEPTPAAPMTAAPAPADPAPADPADLAVPVAAPDADAGSVVTAAPAVCPSCGAPILPADQFCESCGATLVELGHAPAPGAAPAPSSGDGPAIDLSAPSPDPALEEGTQLLIPGALSAPTAPQPARPRCQACGEGEIEDDGYCTLCGAKAVSERDHWQEQPAPWVGAVCDRGIRHYRNEDGMALTADAEPGSFAALVVCDGVTNSTDSDKASLAAAVAARDVLRAAHATAPDGDDDRTQFWMKQFEAACAAAQGKAVEAAVVVGSPTSPPACTFVAAIVHGPLIVAAWAGDSRAYWLPDGQPASQLSVDDSWATEQIANGMSRQVAEADSQAHSITKWLGVDSPDPTPRCSVETVDGAGGWLLVCSDGLWNYCSDAVALRALIDTTAGRVGDDPLAVAGGLVDWANEQGGVDNIAAVLARVPAPDPAEPIS